MLSSKPVIVAVLLLFGLINPVWSVTVRINALGDSITGSPVTTPRFQSYQRDPLISIQGLLACPPLADAPECRRN
jgi:hypothetical protein